MKWIAHIEGGPKRVNHAAVTVDHKIYTFGGYCTGESSNEYTSIDVHILNTTTFRWTKHPVSDLPYFENDDIVPYKRYGHTAVVYQDKIYIWGGRNDHESCGELFCLDTRYHCWTAPETTGAIPPARDGHTACVWRHYMYIFGGFEEESDTFARSVHILNLHTMCWKYVHSTGLEPAVRDFHSAACINDRMYIFGGRGTELHHSLHLREKEVYCNELWYLDLQTHTWCKPHTTGTQPIGRRSHSAFVYNGKMYIFGGYNALKLQHYNDLFEYDPITSEWTLIKPQGNGPCSRRRQACIVVSDRVFLFGGTSPKPTPRTHARLHTVEEKLTDHSDMYILDFKPSLKTLCISAVHDYKLDFSILPLSLKTEVENMLVPNKIVINRPNNSTG
ncbi:hypothetical protein PPYR_00841 [Photinus pyralis]|uniref:Kelch domain-containing protein 3 n=1 Tax=Photinus pyralis TaxID=7054 RepID=A0A1Y1NF99_PHOPY|nr:kelch domain-containing protein 3-like [Photinus pyralis]XP_031342112.1 kelch domain-containing protein 3-like [Photinus pyralis]KAB0799598.1 hypothetical protein PPYR_07478 [Photinus pyralis]KAB0803871.1 hypothetical protein PPYR_00841 [Photinus pyralis]